jgi:hypothetical protein
MLIDSELSMAREVNEASGTEVEIMDRFSYEVLLDKWLPIRGRGLTCDGELHHRKGFKASMQTDTAGMMSSELSLGV